MSTNKTQNYQLHGWASEDEFPRSELNANFTKLDTALKAEETARAGAVNTLNTALAGKAAIVTGSYTGNDESERTISLGFTPKAVYLCREDGSAGYSSGSAMCFGGLALPNLPVYASGNLVTCVVGGIQVRNRSSFLTTNSASRKYHYIAFR